MNELYVKTFGTAQLDDDAQQSAERPSWIIRMEYGESIADPFILIAMEMGCPSLV